MWSRAGLVRSVDDRDQVCSRHVAVERGVHMESMVPWKPLLEGCTGKQIFVRTVWMS